MLASNVSFFLFFLFLYCSSCYSIDFKKNASIGHGLLQDKFTRRPVFWVCDQVALKPACSGTDSSSRLANLASASIHIILSRQRTTKALIRLRRCLMIMEDDCFYFVSAVKFYSYMYMEQ